VLPLSRETSSRSKQVDAEYEYVLSVLSSVAGRHDFLEYSYDPSIAASETKAFGNAASVVRQHPALS
jgi:hypothetical protein